MIEVEHDMLPDAVRAGLARAQDRDRRATGGRLRVQVGEVWHPILSYDADGFEVSLDAAMTLRGLVEIHDGPRHVHSALVVATEPAGGVVRYVFKRSTPARAAAPLDYAREGEAPAGYLARD